MAAGAPAGLPPRIWLVIEANGKRHFVEKELLGGAAEWAKGTNATVIEYKFETVAYQPPPKKAKPKA